MLGKSFFAVIVIILNLIEPLPYEHDFQLLDNYPKVIL